jgi:hypothetical protein
MIMGVCEIHALELAAVEGVYICRYKRNNESDRARRNLKLIRKKEM